MTTAGWAAVCQPPRVRDPIGAAPGDSITEIAADRGQIEDDCWLGEVELLTAEQIYASGWRRGVSEGRLSRTRIAAPPPDRKRQV